MVTLDIAPLRSFVAVAAFSGVRQAGLALHLSRSAVTGHIRKLERELGCRLVEPQGRGIALTSDGEELAERAREILRQHDDAVRALATPEADDLLVAATEHAAEFLIPVVVGLIEHRFPHRRIQLRLTRSAKVRALVDDERADIALMLTGPTPRSVRVATIPSQWFGTPGTPPDHLVLFTEPCAVRLQALTTLGNRPYRIIKQCHDLTTLLSAARNGTGIVPLPRIGPAPDGLRPVPDMPALPDLTLHAATSPRVDPVTRTAIVDALRERLTEKTPALTTT
ncbi:LysR family transcriptional regulator [Nocardia callitridis]|uniref:LysR family transcriptional regulator n=1 Tax=Nocardia callitridis TaxID=648753 RepID=A0ABP9K452_9NOCA